MRFFHIFSFATTIYLLLASSITEINAQDSQLILAPAIIRTTVDDPSIPIEAVYHLKNTTDQSIEIVALPQTINSHDPVGRPILSDINIQENDVTSQIEINPSSATLFPDEEITFTATIHPQFLQPGGNYAIVIFKQMTQETDSTHNIIPVISGLLQIRNPEGEDRRLHLNSMSLPSFTTKLPEEINVEFQNPGNSDVTPYGDVLASSSVGQSINVGYLNQDSHIVYPGQISNITTTLKQAIPAKPIDLLTFSISGHDEIDSIHFNHQQKMIYISPFIIFLFILIIFSLIVLVVNKKKKLISIKATRKDKIS